MAGDLVGSSDIQVERSAPNSVDQPSLAAPTTQSRIQDGLFRAHAVATAHAYWREWLDFIDWCSERMLASLPAQVDTITDYIADHSSSLSLSSLHRKLAAISCAHALCDEVSPTSDPLVRAAIHEVRQRAGRERLRKAGLTPDDIARIATSLPQTLQGDRDRFIISLGYATSLRRATLAALDKSDIDEGPDSITIYPNRHTADGTSTLSILVPRNRRSDICSVTAYKRWIDASGIDGGPLFRWIPRHGHLRVDGLSDKAVVIVVKRGRPRRQGPKPLRSELLARRGNSQRVSTPPIQLISATVRDGLLRASDPTDRSDLTDPSDLTRA